MKTVMKNKIIAGSVVSVVCLSFAISNAKASGINGEEAFRNSLNLLPAAARLELPEPAQPSVQPYPRDSWAKEAAQELRKELKQQGIAAKVTVAGPGQEPFLAVEFKSWADYELIKDLFFQDPGDNPSYMGVKVSPRVAKSNYPSDYSSQKVHVLSKGPALVATVGSGVMDRKLIIGYKKSGILGGLDKISAVVRVTYYGGDGRMKVSERVIEMRKEWQGTGFMTPAMIQQDYVTLTDNTGFRGVHSMELAFFSGSQWDSAYGANYVMNPNEVAASAIQFVSGDGGTEINSSCWDFIVGQMRK